MVTTSNSNQESTRRSDQKESKTLTLRIPVEIHEQIERAAKESEQSLNQFIADAAVEAARIALGEGLQAKTDLAILIDLDSFVGKSGINIDALERTAMVNGRLVRKCSFSTALSKDQDVARQTLLARHYRHEEMPSRDALRLRLAAEAIDANVLGNIQHFVLVSGDEQFGYVSSLLVRQGAKVLGVGVPNTAESSQDFIRAFDAFRYYDQIASPPETDVLQELRKSYADSLIQAVLRLENRGAKAVGAALIPMIKDRHPEVSLELLEFRNWKELAEIARQQDLVTRIEPSGADFLVKLTEQGKARAATIQEESERTSAQFGELSTIKAAIADILGIELPEVSVRFLVFNMAQLTLNEEVTDDGMPLIELSYRVVSRLGPSGIQQNTAYRLLNGLYRCGAFEFRANTENEHDPRILHARIPLQSFDNAFVLNLMRNRKRFPTNCTSERLATAIYGKATHQAKVTAMLKVAADPHFDRANLSKWLENVVDTPT